MNDYQTKREHLQRVRDFLADPHPLETNLSREERAAVVEALNEVMEIHDEPLPCPKCKKSIVPVERHVFGGLMQWVCGCCDVEQVASTRSNAILFWNHYVRKEK